jgi:hypothetical protein
MKEREAAAKRAPAGSVAAQEDEMRKKANHMFKLASNSDIGPSYHHTIEIMERYESGSAAPAWEDPIATTAAAAAAATSTAAADDDAEDVV